MTQQFNNDFSVPQHFSDMVLVVENTEFHVHKCILSMSSPVFESMFTSDFRERDANQIPLPTQRKNEFGDFLRVIYSDVISQGNQINDRNCKSLLQLADEYQVVKVKHLCCKFLISSIEESNCLGICKIAEEYNLEDVLEKCVEKASLMGFVLQTSHEFLELKAETKQRIFEKMGQHFNENVKNNYPIQCTIRESDR